MFSVAHLLNEVYRGEKEATDVVSQLQQAEASEFQARQNAVIRWLRPNPFVVPSQQDWEPGTCAWIKDDKRFRDWQTGGCTTPLWIHGNPGCGKSVLARYLMHHGFDPADTQGNVFAYFLHQKYGRYLTHPDLACSLVAAALRKPEFEGTREKCMVIAYLEKKMAQFNSGSTIPWEYVCHLWGFLMAVSSGFVLIVDGIDEYSSDEMTEFLLEYLSKMAQKPQARIIVLSRYTKLIRNLLGKAVTIPLEADQTATDIQVFVKAEIERSPQLVGVEDMLLAKCSEDVFLRARLMVDAVKQAPNIKTQKQILEGFPPGLDSVYAQSIVQTAHRLDKVQLGFRSQLFYLIAGSREPLTLEEIATAMSLDVIQRCVDKQQGPVDIESQLKDLCAPLVVTTDGTARFIHGSVKDYFTNLQKPSTVSIKPHAATVDEFMAHRCLCMLMLPELGDPAFFADLIRQITHIDHEDSIVVPKETSTLWGFYKYAAHHWDHHLMAVEHPSLFTLEMVLEFLKSKHFRTWSKNLSLLHKDDTKVSTVKLCVEIWLRDLPPFMELELRAWKKILKLWKSLPWN